MTVVMIARLNLTLVLISAGQVWAQNAAANWFPGHAGDKRIYEHETRDDIGEGRAHLDIRGWKTEETTIGSWRFPRA